MRKRAAASEKLDLIEKLTRDVTDAAEMLELGAAENDEAVVKDVESGLPGLVARVRQAELRRMLSGQLDHANAIVSIRKGMPVTRMEKNPIAAASTIPGPSRRSARPSDVGGSSTSSGRSR